MITRLAALVLFLMICTRPTVGESQGPGLFVAEPGTARPTCADITSPVPFGTWCFDGNTGTISMWNGTTYVPVTGTAPASATYLLVSPNTGLTSARTLAAGTNITFSDTGGGGTFTINATGGGGSVTGSGASTQVAFWTGASAIAGDSAFIWNNSAKSLTVPLLSVTGAPALSFAPTANPPTTLAAVTQQGSTASTSRVFAGAFGLTVTGGATGDKVALYAGLDKTGGTNDAWSLNTVLTQEAASGSYNAQGYELDVNNLNAHRGDTDGVPGLAAPVSYGFSISGASTFRSTGALLISQSANMWNRGIVIANDSISATGSAFQDLGATHNKSIDIRGTPVYGIYQFSPGVLNFFGGSLDLHGEGRYYGSGATYVGFKGASSIAANKVWTLPNADGTTNQVLKTDGALLLSWTSAGTGTVTHTPGALTVNRLVVGNAVDDVTVLASLGTTTTLLHGNAAGLPTFAGVAIADHTATGTPSATTFYRGDNTWAAPAGSGTVTNSGTLTTNAVIIGGGTTVVSAISLGAAATVLIGTGAAPIFTDTPTVSALTLIGGSLAITPASAVASITLEPVLGGGAGNTGILRFKELTANGTNAVGFKSPDAITADIIWVLPSVDGTSGQFLSTNGSKVLSWVTGSGSVTNSGTLTASAVILGAGTTVVKAMASLGTTTTLLHGNAAGDPTFSGIAIADHTATGTPSASTFYRGDNTWSVPAGGGTVIHTPGALTVHAPIVGNGSDDIRALAVMTNGQGLCGSTGLDPVPCTIGSTTLTVTLGAGTLSINAPDVAVNKVLLGQGAGVAYIGLAVGAANTVLGGTGSAPAFTTTPTVGGITTVNQAAQVLGPYGSSAGNTGELRFLELAANGTNYIGFKAPDAITANFIWTLPSGDGVAGQFLQTNSGVLAWATPAGGGTVVTSGSPAVNQVAYFTPNSTSISGSTGHTWDETNKALTVGPVSSTGGPSVALKVASDTQPMRVERQAAGGGANLAISVFAAVSATQMVDGFGLTQRFVLRDADGVDNIAAAYSVERASGGAGPDTTFKTSLQTTIAGVLADRLIIDAIGAVTIPQLAGAGTATIQADASGLLSRAAGGSITGGGATTQCAYWTGTTVLAGSVGCIWDETNKSLTIGNATSTGAATIALRLASTTAGLRSEVATAAVGSFVNATALVHSTTGGDMTGTFGVGQTFVHRDSVNNLDNIVARLGTQRSGTDDVATFSIQTTITGGGGVLADRIFIDNLGDTYVRRGLGVDRGVTVSVTPLGVVAYNDINGTQLTTLPSRWNLVQGTSGAPNTTGAPLAGLSRVSNITSGTCPGTSTPFDCGAVLSVSGSYTSSSTLPFGPVLYVEGTNASANEILPLITLATSTGGGNAQGGQFDGRSQGSTLGFGIAAEGRVINETTQNCSYDLASTTYYISNCMGFTAVYSTATVGTTSTGKTGGIAFQANTAATSQTQDLWKGGFACGKGGVSDQCFIDVSNTNTSMKINGSHAVGIDLSGGSYSTGIIKVSAPGSQRALCVDSAGIVFVAGGTTC